jgi:hypothetical protein
MKRFKKIKMIVGFCDKGLYFHVICFIFFFPIKSMITGGQGCNSVVQCMYSMQETLVQFSTSQNRERERLGRGRSYDDSQTFQMLSFKGCYYES